MPLEIRFSPRFEKQTRKLQKRYPRVLEDLSTALNDIHAGRSQGARVPGVERPVYKIRMTNVSANRGKRGGFRALYAVEDSETYIFFHLYSKTDANDATIGQIRELLRALE